MSETNTDPSTSKNIFDMLGTNEMVLFGFLINLCGVLAIFISCGLTLYHAGYLHEPFNIQDFGDGIGKLIQDDLIATGILAGGMGVKAKLSN